MHKLKRISLFTKKYIIYTNNKRDMNIGDGVSLKVVRERVSVDQIELSEVRINHLTVLEMLHPGKRVI